MIRFQEVSVPLPWSMFHYPWPRSDAGSGNSLLLLPLVVPLAGKRRHCKSHVLDMWFTMAQLILKSCLHRRLEPIFKVDSAVLHPNTLPCSSLISTWFPYVHTPWGWSLSQCEPWWGWYHGVYPCILSIMWTAGNLFWSSGGRRQVISMSALLCVCLQIPLFSALPGNSALKFRDPSWLDDTTPTTQNVTPCSSSIGISILVPCTRSWCLVPAVLYLIPVPHHVRIIPGGHHVPDLRTVAPLASARVGYWRFPVSPRVWGGNYAACGGIGPYQDSSHCHCRAVGRIQWYFCYSLVCRPSPPGCVLSSFSCRWDVGTILVQIPGRREVIVF